MVSRRKILKGAAAGSIAAIASAHGVTAQEADDLGAFVAGFGTLEDGGLGVFHKVTEGYEVFLKWHKSAARVFYKFNDSSGLDVFLKFFKSREGWSPVMPIDSVVGAVIEGADAGFHKVQPDGASFFVKFADGQRAHYLNVGSDGQYEFQPPECRIFD